MLQAVTFRFKCIVLQQACRLRQGALIAPAEVITLNHKTGVVIG